MAGAALYVGALIGQVSTEPAEEERQKEVCGRVFYHTRIICTWYKFVPCTRKDV